MNPPPIPQPSAETCRNCGSPVPAGAPFCPHCGTPLQRSSNNSGCFTIGIQIVLACFAMMFGGLGACFAVIGGFSLDSGGIQFFGIGLVGVLLAAACIFAIIKLAKR